MMMLRTAPPSPFGRKVKIAASVLGLSDRIEIVNADTMDPHEKLRHQNPLGKIPTLITDDGTPLFDSRVILDYLDHLAGGNRIFPAGQARFAVLTLQALADGLMDAALMQVYEARWRAEDKRDAAWLAHQAGKVSRAMASLEARPPALDAMPNAGQIAVACALGYLDLRFQGRWRQDHPHLVAWLDAFDDQVPAFDKTRVTT